MASPESGDDATMRARLQALTGALDSQRKGNVGPDPAPSPAGLGQAMSLGFRVMSEFVAAVVVGAILGWAIDRGLGSAPAALIVFIALGTAAGFWNVYRIATKPTGSAGSR